jgi:hypothetical protein
MICLRKKGERNSHIHIMVKALRRSHIHTIAFHSVGCSPAVPKHIWLTIRIVEHFGKLWRAASGFSDLCALNRKFISGEISATPYADSLDENNYPIMDVLLRLNDSQLLTESAQQYQNQHAIDMGDCWLENQQRPYISFIMQGRDGQGVKCFKRLQERPGIVVRASKIYPFSILPGSHEMITVGRTRDAETISALGSAKWKGWKWGLRSAAGKLDELFCLDAMKQSDPLWIEVAASEWGVVIDVLSIVQEVAVECGLSRSS